MILRDYVLAQEPHAFRTPTVIRTTCINRNCSNYENTTKKKLWVYGEEDIGYCYRCHRVFQGWQFVSYFERCNMREAKKRWDGGATDVPDAIKRAIEKMSTRPPPKVIAPVTPLPKEFRKFTQDHFPAFAKKRGLTLKQCKRYGIGWCISGENKNRLVVPVLHNRKQVAYIARAMWEVDDDGDGLINKKTLHSPGIGHYLFNYDTAKDYETIFIVEGVFDAIRIGPDAVACFGTNLTVHQVALLMASAAKRVIVLLDPDAYTTQTEAMIARLSVRFSVSNPAIRCDPDELTDRELARVRKAPSSTSSMMARARALLSPA